MLEETQAESESHQAALRDCQDMLEELQTFSQGRETRLQSLQQELQVSLHLSPTNTCDRSSAEVCDPASCTTNAMDPQLVSHDCNRHNPPVLRCLGYKQ